MLLSPLNHFPVWLYVTFDLKSLRSIKISFIFFLLEIDIQSKIDRHTLTKYYNWWRRWYYWLFQIWAILAVESVREDNRHFLSFVFFFLSAYFSFRNTKVNFLSIIKYIIPASFESYSRVLKTIKQTRFRTKSHIRVKNPWTKISYKFYSIR